MTQLLVHSVSPHVCSKIIPSDISWILSNNIRLGLGQIGLNNQLLNMIRYCILIYVILDLRVTVHSRQLKFYTELSNLQKRKNLQKCSYATVCTMYCVSNRLFCIVKMYCIMRLIHFTGVLYLYKWNFIYRCFHLGSGSGITSRSVSASWTNNCSIFWSKLQ